MFECRRFLTNESIIYLSIYLPVYGSTALCRTLDAFSVSWSFYTVGRTLWTVDQPVTRPLPAHRTAQTQNKCTQASTPQVGFEPTIPVFKRAKTVHALDREASVIGNKGNCVVYVTEPLSPAVTPVLIYILPTECLCVFRMVLTINSDRFPKQHKEVDLCSREVIGFLWGTYWIFIRYLEEIQSTKG
jgi:hypothetical protein